MLNLFPPHLADFYKTGHIRQYPDGTQMVYSNFTCRSDGHANVLPDFDHKVVCFGPQAVAQWLLIDLWNRNFFYQPLNKVIARYQRRMDRALGPGAVGTDHIAALHELGYLPIELKVLPEGSRVDIRVPLWTIRSTQAEFYWVTNYLETQLSAEMWKMVTSATIAFEYRRLFNSYAIATGSSLDFVPWQGHDFSMRGMSGVWDATQSGAAHLLSFTGTDTISAIDFLEDFYPDSADPFIGGSVPATEHSVMCMGGEEDELGTFRRLIDVVYPKGIVSIVADSWDFWQVITSYTVSLKDEIMARDGKVVFRPDSGDPVRILTGLVVDTLDTVWAGSECVIDELGVYREVIPTDENRIGFKLGAEIPEYVVKGAVECLWDVFGGTLTDLGFKQLDSHVGLIYGDSITLDRAQQILKRLKDKGFSSGNVVLGIGSYTYQYATRDTFGTAIKATAGVVNGEFRELFKDPKTDSGTKKSARGYIRVENEDRSFVLYDQQNEAGEQSGLLQTVFKDGSMRRMQTLSEIRDRLAVELKQLEAEPVSA